MAAAFSPIMIVGAWVQAFNAAHLREMMLLTMLSLLFFLR